ncbi:mechanosensitive ion channel family protein [Mongoliibacter ruber]|uniref:Miniconductance mechanosensitive channel n=1 Tax=Mongoliibacter ruber TaxID=1750599 RepID=A0A2T0WF62_9BACT|nr:mechanosensitive ion channel domain-containing protein [Mongoliibacter ruber]PRY85164.1 miniconductance mechanosensitive channel [Mongoliibacter ruber]
MIENSYVLMDYIENWVETTLINSGVSHETEIYLRLLILLFGTLIIAGLVYLITKKIVIHYIYKLFRKSPISWDDVLADHQVFNHVAHLLPAILIRELTQSIFRDFEFWKPIVIKLTDSYLAIVTMLLIMAFLKVIEFGLSKKAALQDKPINSYFQLIRIILYIATGIMVLSIIMGRSPIYFLSAFGAMTAILMLVFKDTILGLVASVQMSANDMVRVGDWVEMPNFNADGDVVAMNLNTVKVQNWDKTITTIPTYYFITHSFKNWRGMVESGGRRIKRSIYINSQTVKFVDPEKREYFKRFHLLTDFISQRQKEIEQYNTSKKLDQEILINGRRMTNIGVFRFYLEAYLKNHPNIRQDMTIMVRQMPVGDDGIPMEIYCFTNTTAWLEYEDIQSDIFDHIMASVKFFDLEIFQEPTGNDFIRAADKFKELSKMPEKLEIKGMDN